MSDDELDRMRGILDDLLTAAENYFTNVADKHGRSKLNAAMRAAHKALAGEGD